MSSKLFLGINSLPSNKLNTHDIQKFKDSLYNVLTITDIRMHNTISEEFIRKNYPIQTGLNNPILRTISEKVNEIDDEIKEFGKIIHKAMEIYDGIGLAAPQIGVNKRVIAICQLNKKENKIIFSDVLINPEIVEKSDKMFIQEEACLSLPGLEGNVKRHWKVKVKYIGLDGKKHELNATGLNAAIIQHEIDHLDGVLFWDKVEGKQGMSFKNMLNL